MRINNKVALSVSILILSSVFAVAFMTADELYVMAPGFACVVAVAWLWMTLWNRDHKIPFFDVGIFCALATLVYTVYPLLNYWVDGLQFGFLSDFRLQSYRISPAELGFFHLRHVLYLFSFVVFYSGFRRKGTIEVANVSAPNQSARTAIVLFFLLLTGYFVLLQLTTGVNFNPSYEAESYAKYVAIPEKLPLLLLQISLKLKSILFVFKLALLFIVVSRTRKQMWRIILVVWVAAEIVNAFILKGARTDLLLVLVAAALLYHRMIKPFSMKFLITSGAMVFVLFIFLGLYRSYIDIADMQADLSRTDAGIFAAGNEFQSLLGTEYDVYRRKEAGAYLPWYLYINDFITILPPQQLIPFEKIAASEWYLREIGLSGTGLGLMWGVISQSIIGLDWLELALRGAILGYILARFHRWYLKHQSGFLETLVYMFFCLRMYYTYRDSTFGPLANLVWEVIPFYILLRIGVAILSRKVGGKLAQKIAMSSHNIK